MNEYSRAAEWLTTKLSSPPITGVTLDAAGTPVVTEHPAAAGTAGKWITFHAQHTEDVRTADERRVMTTLLMLVRVISKTRSSGELKAIADEIDRRLERTSGVTSDARILQCVRHSPFHLAETDRNGVDYRHLGGFYEITIQPLAA